jgi:hypothetical protein
MAERAKYSCSALIRFYIPRSPHQARDSLLRGPVRFFVAPNFMCGVTFGKRDAND